jgi:hyperosmotically inducible periplasmic protein
MRRLIAPMVALLLAGCAQGNGGPTTTASRPHDEALTASVLRRLHEADTSAFRAISATVLGNRVMLTGAVIKPDHRRRAERAAAEVDGIVTVHNSLLVAEAGTFPLFVPDTARERDLMGMLTAAGDIAMGNYDLRMVNGVVYLLGTARSAAELERVKAVLMGVAAVKWVDAAAVVVP